MKDALNDARAVDNLCVEVSKSLATAKSRNKDLALELATTDRDQKSAETGLKTTEAQAEEQLKKLHYAEIEQAMAIQQVANLKERLVKAKEATQAVVDATGQKFFNPGV